MSKKSARLFENALQLLRNPRPPALELAIDLTAWIMRDRSMPCLNVSPRQVLYEALGAETAEEAEAKVHQLPWHDSVAFRSQIRIAYIRTLERVADGKQPRG
jgi:hypothetical protein